MEHDFIYGVNPASEVINSQKRTIRRAYVNSSASPKSRVKKMAGALEHLGIPVQAVEKGRLNHIGKTSEHQGIVLEVDAYPYADSDNFWEVNRLVLLDNIEDPHNMGAILRSAEIFGYRHILLPKRGVPYVYPSVVKASAGAVEYLEIARDRSANQYVMKAKEKAIKVVALDAAGTIPLNALVTELTEPFLIVIGGENKSVGQYILNEADYVTAIPQQGHISSLNASVAAGIVLQALS